MAPKIWEHGLNSISFHSEWNGPFSLQRWINLQDKQNIICQEIYLSHSLGCCLIFYEWVPDGDGWDQYMEDGRSPSHQHRPHVQKARPLHAVTLNKECLVLREVILSLSRQNCLSVRVGL